MKREDMELEEPASDLVSGLSAMPKVQAPMGFEARVRARISEKRGRSPFRFRVVPAFASVALVLVIAGLFLVGRRDRVEEVAEVSQSFPRVESSSDQKPAKEASVPSDKSPVVREVGRADRADGLIVRDEGAKSAPVVDAGTATGGRETGDSVRPRPATLGAAEYLAGLGASITLKGGQLTVGAVAPGSASERSGLQVGDVIVAVDGIAFTAGTVLQADFRGRVLQVRRPGEAKLLLLPIK